MDNIEEKVMIKFRKHFSKNLVGENDYFCPEPELEAFMGDVKKLFISDYQQSLLEGIEKLRYPGIRAVGSTPYEVNKALDQVEELLKEDM